MLSASMTSSRKKIDGVLSAPFIFHLTEAVAWPAQKFAGGSKMFGFRRITLFVWDTASQNTKYTIYAKNVGGMAPRLRLCTEVHFTD